MTKTTPTTLGILIVVLVAGIAGASVLLHNQKNEEKIISEEHFLQVRRNVYPPYKLPKSFFIESFANLPDTVISSDTEIAGIIVNHHLLGSRLISRAFDNISYLNPKTIVLLSPNHFGVGFNSVISSEYDWQTHYGLLKNNKSMREEMIELGLIHIDEAPFPEEHGISGLTSYIKHTFPEAEFIPIIFQDETKEEDVLRISSYFSQFDTDEILIIASLDFSHDSTSEIADRRDKISIEILESMDIERIEEVEVDSRPALMLLMDYAIKKGALNFNLLDNTNSAKLTNDLDIADATSYINCYFSK